MSKRVRCKSQKGEKWKPIPGFEGLYEISNKARIRFRDTRGLKGGTKDHLYKWYIRTPSLQPRGYHNVHFSVGKIRYRFKLSRLVYELFVQPIPEGYEVDHINNNPTDNSIKNLRLASRHENCFNQKPQSHVGKLSKYKGVSLTDRTKHMWRAYIKKQGKAYHLGNFKTEKEAALAYNMKAKELFGKFAHLNKVT